MSIVGIEKGKIEEGGFEGICLSLTMKHLDFTVPPAVALLNCERNCNTFADFGIPLFIIISLKLEKHQSCEGRGERSAPVFVLS